MKQVADKILFNALVVTIDEQMAVFENGAVAVSEDSIVALGESQDVLAQYQAEEMYDAAGAIIMPGLIDDHAHLATTLFRGLAEDMPLEPWLQKVWRAESAFLSDRNVEIAARLGMCELLMGGTTCAVDMYWFPDAAARAALDMGFRLCNGPVFLEMDDAPDGMDLPQRIDFARDFMVQFAAQDTLHTMLMPHSTYTDAPATLQAIKALADELDVWLHIHTAETAAEVEDVRARYGHTPIRLLDSLGLLDERILLAHCVHIDEEEIGLIAARGSSVVHNPLSNMKLASGFASITRMQESQVKLSIGTDGATCSNDLDMWWSMRLAALLQKGHNQDASLMKAEDVVRMATIGGARAIGLDHLVGSLEVGKKADLIMLRRSAPHLTPLYDIYAHLVYTTGREDVESVMINGQWVMQQRKLARVDLQQAMDEVNALACEIQQLYQQV